MDVAQLEALFLLVAKGSQMKELDLLDTDLTSLEPQLLGLAINKLEKVNLSGSKLFGDQLNSMMDQLDFKSLQDLNFDYLDLSQISELGLSKLLSSARKISLKKCKLTPQLLNSALEAIENKTKLKRVNLHGNILRGVCPEYLEGLAVQLDHLDLSQTDLPEETVTRVLTTLGTSDCRLRGLTLAGVSLSAVSADVMRLVMTKLERLDLSNCDLTPSQLNFILADLSPPLREISLFNVRLDELDKEVLRRANEKVFIKHRYHI